jgi:uncharacterized membrane protein
MLNYALIVLAILNTALLFWLCRKIYFIDKDVDCMHTTMNSILDEAHEFEDVFNALSENELIELTSWKQWDESEAE